MINTIYNVIKYYHQHSNIIMNRIILIVFILATIVTSNLSFQGCQIFTNEPIQVELPSQSQQPVLNRPEIVSFEISPVEISLGQSATLAWEVKGATEIDLSPGMGYVPATGTKTVTPVERTVYTIRAVNKAGSISKGVTVSVNKNLRAVELALTEEDVKPKSFKFDMNTEITAAGTSSTYRILFTRSSIVKQILENSVYVYENKSFMQRVFDEDKYNIRVYITNPLLLIGDEGYIMTDKSSEPDIPPTFSIKFLKNNVYVKLIGNIPLNELEAFARLVEGRIR